MFFQIAKMSPKVWATLARKFVTQNLSKVAKSGHTVATSFFNVNVAWKDCIAFLLPVSLFGILIKKLMTGCVQLPVTKSMCQCCNHFCHCVVAFNYLTHLLCKGSVSLYSWPNVFLVWIQLLCLLESKPGSQLHSDTSP